MPAISHSQLVRYGSALCSVVVATVARMLISPMVGDRVPFITYFVAVAITAWYAGLGPALLTVVCCSLAAAYFFIAPTGEFMLGASAGYVELTLFAVFSAGIALLSESTRVARLRVERSAEEIARQRERFLVTLASIGDGVLVTDAAGLVDYLNPVAEQLTGWSQFEAQGKPLETVFPIINERTGDPAENPIWKALQEGTVVGMANHTALVGKDGTQRAIDDSAAPIRAPDGRITGAVLVFRDVSTSRQIHFERRRLAALVESSDDAIIGYDLEGTLTHWNAAAERMFGYTAEEAIGQPVQTRIVPESRLAELDEIIAQISRGQRVEHFESVRMRKDGQRIYVSLGISPIYDADGHVVGVCAIDRDISQRKQLEEQLRSRVQALAEAEMRIRSVVDNVLDGIITIDEGGTIQTFNFAAEKLFGYTAADVIGQNVKLLMPPQYHDPHESALAHYLQTGEARVIGIGREAEGRRRDGSSFPIELAVSEFHVAGKRLFTGIVRDITSRKHTEGMLRFLADASASLAVLHDMQSTLQKVARLAVPDFADWCIVDMLDEEGSLQRMAMAHVDPKRQDLAERMSQEYSPRPDTPYGPAHVARTGKAEMAAELSDEILQAASNNPDHLRLLRELDLKSYMCVPLVVREKTLGVLTFVTAESGRRYGSGDLAIAENLAYRAAVAIENARLYQELREADRRKDEFLAMLAHELRNPLAPIRSGLDLLGIDPNRDDGEVVNLMQHQVEHLVRLVDDLLDVSRIMRGKIELRCEAIELKAVVGRAVDTVRSTVNQREQRLEVNVPEEPIWLNADLVRLTQVLDNLLNNASKYTDRGGRIELIAQREGNQVAVSICDNGIGIEPTLLAKVFDPFTQSSRAVDRSQGGLGIGLTLVRSLVQMHGGSVVAQSDGLNRGSRFTVRLPVLSQTPTLAPGQGPPQIAQERVILVVDDNVVAARMLSMLLGRLGSHRVEVVHDGLVALETAEALRPDLVLLDIGLPGIDGYEVAKRLRADGGCRDCLLVALTGYGQEEDRRRSLAAGFDEHLVKPLDVGQLRQLLVHPKLMVRQE